MPNKAQILKRKDGVYARFRTPRSHMQEARLTRNKKGILVKTAHWHIAFEDNLGLRRQLKAFTDKQATRRLADHIERMLHAKCNNMPFEPETRRAIELLPKNIKQKLIGFGLLETKDSAIGKPLETMLDDYRQSLEADERSKKYISETMSMCHKIFDGCGFKYFSDIQPNKVQTFLQDLRNGPKCLSYRRSNGYQKAVKLFCNWCVKRRYVFESPLKSLRELDPELDRRHERRAVSIGEIKALLCAALKGSERYGMMGFERFLIYRLVIETGLRANEIRQLRKADFDLENSCVMVRAISAKGKRQDTQQLRPELSRDIETFLKNRLPQTRAFGGRYKQLTDRTADMLKEDLAAAKIPYENDLGQVFDFHALRGQCASLLAACGATPKTVQAIMRHQDVNLSMNVYTHVLQGGEAKALEQLPDFSVSAIASQQETVKTGTNDEPEQPKSLSKSCFSDEQIRTEYPPSMNCGGQNPPVNDSKTGITTRPMRLELTTFGSTVRCSNQLSYGPTKTIETLLCH